MSSQNKIYFVPAGVIWPVGNAGAVVIAATSKKAFEMAEGCGLERPGKPEVIGRTNKKEQVVFYNTTNY